MHAMLLPTDNFDSILNYTSGQIVQYVELYVTNHNLGELLRTDRYERLTDTLSEIYPVTGGPLVLTLIDPRDRGILVPEPPAKLG